MATIKFRILSKSDSAEIYARFSINRDNVFQSKIGFSINAKDWSKKTNLPLEKTPENKQLKIKLENLRAEILNNYNSAQSIGEPISKEWLQLQINTFFNRIEKALDNNVAINYLKYYYENAIDLNSKKPINEQKKGTTLQKYKILITKFESFQAYKKKEYLLSQVDDEVMESFKHYLITVDNLMGSTANRTLKNLKTVLYHAELNQKIKVKVNSTFKTVKTPIKGVSIVYLSFDELDQIQSAKIISEKILITRDWLIIGCYAGQRVSDLMRMNKSMIYTKTNKNNNKYKFIELVQVKTGKKVSIPVIKEIQNVLDKYNGGFPPLFSNEPQANATLFNRYLKDLGRICNINNMMIGKVFNDKEKRNEVRETEKFNLLTSHVCRRSYATNFYTNKNFKTSMLMAITGHKTEQVFLNYIGKENDDFSMEMAEIFEEIEISNNLINIAN